MALGPKQFGTRTIMLRRRHKWKLVAAIGGLVLVVVLMYLLAGIFAPLLVALMLAYILNPVVCFLERRGLSRASAVRVIYLLLALAVTGIIAFGVPMSVQQVVEWTWAFQGEYVEPPEKGEVLDPDVRRVPGESYKDQNRNGKYDPPEPFTDADYDGRYDPPEPLADRNGNGLWDSGEPFKDANGNARHDPGEDFTDKNSNFKWDSPEKYHDANRNGKWDDGEEFDDLNGNGFYDSGEPMEDLNGNGKLDGVLFYKDCNGNGKPDVGYIEEIRRASADPNHWFGGALGRVWKWGNRQDVVDQALSRAKENASELASKSAEYASGGLKAVFSTVSKLLYFLMAIILIPIYTYFFLMGLNELYGTAVSYIPRNVRDEVVDILGQIHEVNAAFFRGRLVICIVMGAASTVGFIAFGLRFSIIFGVLMTLAGLVPFMPVVVMIPAVLVAMVDLPWWGVAGVIASGAVGQALDWPLSTWIMGKQLKLHPITIIISLFIFTKVLGVVGLLLSVPVVASLKILGREFLMPHLKEIADGPPESSLQKALGVEDGPPGIE